MSGIFDELNALPILLQMLLNPASDFFIDPDVLRVPISLFISAFGVCLLLLSENQGDTVSGKVVLCLFAATAAAPWFLSSYWTNLLVIILSVIGVPILVMEAISIADTFTSKSFYRRGVFLVAAILVVLAAINPPALLIKATLITLECASMIRFLLMADFSSPAVSPNRSSSILVATPLCLLSALIWFLPPEGFQQVRESATSATAAIIVEVASIIRSSAYFLFILASIPIVILIKTNSRKENRKEHYAWYACSALAALVVSSCVKYFSN